MNRIILAAAAAMVAGTFGTAEAATLSGTFAVTAVNVTNLDSTQSQATIGNFNTVTSLANGGTNSPFGSNSTATMDTFFYTGALDFQVLNTTPYNSSAPTTIAQWLATGVNGSVSGLDALFGGLQLSKANISNGSATTTFFLFELLGSLSAADLVANHDDGIAVFDDGTRIGGRVGPNSLATTHVNGFDGGKFDLLYVATNSDPSILKVTSPSDLTVAPVPLPAPFALLAAGLAALGVVGMRRKAA